MVVWGKRLLEVPSLFVQCYVYELRTTDDSLAPVGLPIFVFYVNWLYKAQRFFSGILVRSGMSNIIM
jgi:hypothetical protein